MIFWTKLVNDKLYAKNGQTVDILEDVDDNFFWVRFEDGTEASVYKTEVVLTKEEADAAKITQAITV